MKIIGCLECKLQDSGRTLIIITFSDEEGHDQYDVAVCIYVIDVSV